MYSLRQLPRPARLSWREPSDESYSERLRVRRYVKLLPLPGHPIGLAEKNSIHVRPVELKRVPSSLAIKSG